MTDMSDKKAMAAERLRLAAGRIPADDGRTYPRAVVELAHAMAEFARQHLLPPGPALMTPEDLVKNVLEHADATNGPVAVQAVRYDRKQILAAIKCLPLTDGRGEPAAAGPTVARWVGYPELVALLTQGET